jgi:hypothetical protein
MPRHRKEPSTDSTSIADPVKQLAAEIAPPTRSSKLPSRLTFPLLVILYWSINVVLNTLVGEFTDHELGRASRKDPDWSYAAVLHGWKLVELSLCWVGGYDGRYSNI